jgi:ABC-type transport system involved in cytochrome c biogenesis permease subunit
MASDPIAPLAALACFLLAAGFLVVSPCRAQLRPVGIWLGAAGVAILAGALAARGLRAAHWPLTNQYEVALAFALGTALAALTVDTGQTDRSFTVQAVSILLAAALVAYARLLLPDVKRAIQPLPPALDSVWLPLHVGTAALAYGTLAVAGAAGLVWLARAPERTAIGRTLHRGISAGYPLLTLSLIFGLIWAQVAWGRYWAWDLKEVWTLITWLVYTLYWHLHRRPGWLGRRTAWLAMAGLAAVLFTFLGVGWLARSIGLQSLHLF